MRYNPNLNYQKRNKFLRRVRIVIALLFVVAAGLAAWGYYTLINDQQSNTDASTTSRETSGFFAPSVKIFRSPYFQFQANNTWGEVPAESTPTKYLYRSFRNNLIEHELVIYVNEIPGELAANRILPANPQNDSELLPITVSEHCIKAAGGPTIQNKVVTLERVTFSCHADSTNYTVLVGLVGGSSVLELVRPDKSPAKYAILYTNLKATPDGSQIVQIVDSFQTR